MSTRENGIEDEANRLYWSTELSVGEISERLGLSRRALYSSIRPRPAGRTCPQCGDELSYQNRSAAQSGDASCPTCGAESDIEEATIAPITPPAGLPPESPGAPLDTESALLRARVMMIGGAALAGALIAAVATLAVTRRD